MRFCSQCGGTIELRVPEGEDRERHVCTACSVVHYQNPKMVVGCMIEHEGKLLLCKRAIEPRRGLWTVPAGFLELGEGAAAGARRESYEEACVNVEVLAPYTQFDIPHIGQVYMIYRARMIEPTFGPGPESEEVKLVSPAEIPWEHIAFPVVRYALDFMVDDMRRGRYRTHHGVVVREPDGFKLREHIVLSVS